MIIAISAPAYKSGKDTVAGIIRKHSIYQFGELRFADKLKDFVCRLIGCTREQLEDQDFKASFLGPEWDYEDMSFVERDGHRHTVYTLKQMTVRDLLIRIGDGLRNCVGPKVWVNGARSTYIQNNNNRKEEYHCIVTDWRYEEGEGEFLEEFNAYTIRVIRPDQPLIDSPSERSLDNYKHMFTIINDGDLDDLEKKVIQVLNDIELMEEFNNG